jgi:hypothetical protein
VRQSLEQRGDDATGWGIGWRLNLWARLQDAERAHHNLGLLLCTLRYGAGRLELQLVPGQKKTLGALDFASNLAK